MRRRHPQQISNFYWFWASGLQATATLPKHWPKKQLEKLEDMIVYC